MGMTLTVRPSRPLPPWSDVTAELAHRGLSVQTRMIDGQLAFPDEAPPNGWREVRLGTPHGMVTVQRTGEAFAVVVWGNADEGLRGDWRSIAEALAGLTGGAVSE